nr:MAG TPA: hypothetical protein [Caudoviricetes sp.]
MLFFAIFRQFSKPLILLHLHRFQKISEIATNAYTG